MAGATPAEAHRPNRVPLEDALYAPYWQFAPKQRQGMIVLDCDHVDPVERVMGGHIVPPTAVVWNEENGHSHALYILTHPVSRGQESKLGPIKYMDAVRRGLTAVMGADARYTHDLSRGPLAPGHLLEVISGRTYELADLAKGLDLRRAAPLHDLPDVADVDGRNTALFEVLRGELRGWTDRFADADQLRAHLVDKAAEFQGLLAQHPSGPLPLSEVRSTVASVVGYGSAHRHAEPRRAPKVPGAVDRSQIYSTDRPAVAPVPVQQARQAAGGKHTAERRRETTRASLRAAVSTLRAQGQPVTAQGLILITNHSKQTIYNHEDVWSQ
ncbi:replication initiation protein [Deinococcus aquatilis]|uniref:replication initiation protein n=1 Tax=Deinococcus aquatilis TaxID=519440 RepID=UPI00146F4055|nr:replication initiation protein [Deinococcus aquatilis]